MLNLGSATPTKRAFDMKSINPPYEFDTFHEQLVALASVTSRSRVLDVGCGTGRTLQYLAGVAKKAIGIDNNENFLERARLLLDDRLKSRRVELQKVDVEQDGLPYQDESFDSVICQNVLECIEDKPSLIHECRRVLDKGGVLLLGHHDFGGVMLNSKSPSLTREVIAAYADETQAWMPLSDGEIGRKIPGLIRSNELGEAITETRQFVGLEFGDETYAREFCRDAAAAAVRARIQQSEVDEWINDLADLDRRREFYFSIPWVYVRETKPVN